MMKLMEYSLQCLFRAFLLTCGLVGWFSTIQSWGQEVTIVDPELEKEIRKGIRVLEGPITQERMDRLTKLDASQLGRGYPAPPIRSLEGIQFARNLKELLLFGWMEDGVVTPNLEEVDLSPLGALSSLNELWLNLNELESIQLPNGLVQLETLYLSGNKLTHLSLPKDMRELRELFLGANRLSDFSFISDMPFIQALDLAGNDLTELHLPRIPHQLRILNLSGNPIRRFELPSTYRHLEILLSFRSGLEELIIPGNLDQLAYLSLHHSHLKSIEFGGPLMGLKNLEASDNQLQDLSFLQHTPFLERLNLSSNPLEIFELPLSLNHLEVLGIRDARLKELRLLYDLPALRSLNASFNQLTHVELPLIPQDRGSVVKIDVSQNQMERMSVPLGSRINHVNLIGFPKDEVGFHGGFLRRDGEFLSWNFGTLQFAPSPNGPWSGVTSKSPYRIDFKQVNGFFRVMTR